MCFIYYFAYKIALDFNFYRAEFSVVQLICKTCTVQAGYIGSHMRDKRGGVSEWKNVCVLVS
jgi:hypothetical protein